MSRAIAAPQRIARLAPVRDVLGVLDRLATPVRPRRIALADALGRVLAVDATVGTAQPVAATAQRDGWAVEAAALADAGAYAPVPLSAAAAWVDAGDPMPAGTDAVLPPDAVVPSAGTQEVIAPVSPGEGIVPAGADFLPHQPIRRAGEALRASDVAVLALAGLEHVEVCAPRLYVVSTNATVDRTQAKSGEGAGFCLSGGGHRVSSNVAGGNGSDAAAQTGNIDGGGTVGG